MITAKFKIEDYLAEYLRGKWGIKDKDGHPTGIVSIPEDIYLYHILWGLMQTRRKNETQVEPNIEVVLPHCRKGDRKNPRFYNYISLQGSEIFNKRLKKFFRADMHEFFDYQKHEEGITYKEAAYLFIAKYDIESIDPDSLAKNYSRWKDNVRLNRKKAYATR